MYIFRCCILIICVSYVQSVYQKNTDFDNLSCEGRANTKEFGSFRSHVECSSYCEKEATCRGFFFNKILKRCYGIEEILTSSLGCVTNVGNVLYVMPVCIPNPCNHGTCIEDGSFSYTCACFVGYTGNTCDTLIDLVPGYLDVYQPSTYLHGEAYKAVDGNSANEWSDGSCTHTGVYELMPSWSLVLKQAYPVQRLVITNRQDCCSERLQSLDIFVDNKLCTHYNGPPDSDEIHVNISCDNNTSVTGSTLTIRKTTGAVITLCEVKVYVA